MEKRPWEVGYTAKDAVTNKITETVLNWSVAGDRQAPHALDDVLLLLSEARLSIPEEYRADAEIDFDPYFDCAGESYPQVRITYDRPETTDEAASRQTHERKHWEQQLQQSRDRVAYCLTQIDGLAP
ncbi:hypothetical protein HFN98_24590 [Rhizobium laguerreae]|uniref:hypothetical protein n=1 Tax=Rhizobium laguerreae TaxID=1076926 RepID=UPI001C9040CB|nr:hypothetical protein [Rhizobium laguerreae]MBY3333772.1 hypothetical protein [Rhizobium laguerreae]